MSSFGRRFSAPVPQRSGSFSAGQTAAVTSAPFVHRDIFASSVPGGLDPAGAAAHATPATPKRRRPSEAYIPQESKLERWDHKLGKYPFLGWLEAHTGVRKVYLASAALLLILLLIFRGTGLWAVSAGVGFLYPLHMSLKTIENCACLAEEISKENRHRHTEEQIAEKREEIVGQLRKWLVYWVVYGLFTTFETLSDFSLSWLPIYHPLKLIFLLWCFLPQYQGSQLVFDILVRPVLVRHEEAIESGVATAQQAAMFSVGRVGRVVRQKSIQLSKAIHVQLVSASGSASAPADLDPSTVSPVRTRIAAIEAIESRSASNSVSSSFSAQLDAVHEHHDEHEHEHADPMSQEGQSFEAFSAASRFVTSRARK